MAYEINININGNMEDVGAVGGSGVSPISNTQSDKVDGNAKRLGKYIAAQTIQPMIQKTISFATSNVELQTGSIAQQQKTDAIMQGVSMGVDTYKNAMAGASIVASLGGSAMAGGALGVALSILNFGLDVMFKQQQIDLKKEHEDYQRAYLYNRAGMAYSQSRRGD